MKVAFIHPGYPAGEGTGASHSATQIVTALAERDHDVTVYCTDDPEPGADIPEGLSLRQLGLSGFPYHSATQLNRALRNRLDEFDAFEVTHSYLMAAIPAMGSITEQTSSASVVTLNAYRGVCPKNDLRYMDRERCDQNGLLRCTACSVATSGGHQDYSRSYRIVSRLGNLAHILTSRDAVTAIDGYQALSPHVERTYVDFDYPEDRIDVIPNILDDRFDVPHESSFEEPYKLLYVGYLEAAKGVDKLLPILSQLRADHDVELTVVGDGGRRDALETAARDRGLTDVVTFRGHVPYRELPAVYANHDLFVYPGEWEEPFGRVFLEALAAGTPVVASDVGSVAEIAGDAGRVTDGNVTEFVASISELLDSETLTALSGAAAQKIEAYRPSTVVTDIEKLYGAVM